LDLNLKSYDARCRFLIEDFRVFALSLNTRFRAKAFADVMIAKSKRFFGTRSSNSKGELDFIKSASLCDWHEDWLARVEFNSDKGRVGFLIPESFLFVTRVAN